MAGRGGSAFGTVAFSGFPFLTGGFGKDTFIMKSGAKVSGAIDGRITGGSNTLDYSQFGARSVVSFRNSSGSGVRNGSGGGVFDFQTIIGSTFGNIAGANGNLIVGPDAATTYAITGANAGTFGNVKFSNFPSVTAGANNDVIKFNNSADLPHDRQQEPLRPHRRPHP